MYRELYINICDTLHTATSYTLSRSARTYPNENNYSLFSACFSLNIYVGCSLWRDLYSTCLHYKLQQNNARWKQKRNKKKKKSKKRKKIYTTTTEGNCRRPFKVIKYICVIHYCTDLYMYIITLFSGWLLLFFDLKEISLVVSRCVFFPRLQRFFFFFCSALRCALSECVRIDFRSHFVCNTICKCRH